MNIEEVKDVVKKLNIELYWKLEQLVDYEEGSLEFILKSNGDVLIVKFLGFDLWNSESDERKHLCSECSCKNFENHCCRLSDIEPLEDFLRQEANRMIKMIENLDFKRA